MSLSCLCVVLIIDLYPLGDLFSLVIYASLLLKPIHLIYNHRDWGKISMPENVYSFVSVELLIHGIKFM